MLCKRPTGHIEESVKDMEGRTFFVEEKLDGERIQMHKRGNEYLYCSRLVLRLLKYCHLNLYQERKGLYVSLRKPRRDRQFDALY